MGVFSLTGWCRQIPTGRLRPRSTQDTAMYIIYFVYGTLTLYCGPFQITSTINYKSILQSYNPKVAVTTLVWAVARSLATTCAITCCFLLLRLLRCFSSPGLLPPCGGYYTFSIVGCPIRKSTDQIVFANPRSLSQLITSFFASESLGILHALLITFFCYSFFHSYR